MRRSNGFLFILMGAFILNSGVFWGYMNASIQLGEYKYLIGGLFILLGLFLIVSEIKFTRELILHILLFLLLLSPIWGTLLFSYFN